MIVRLTACLPGRNSTWNLTGLSVALIFATLQPRRAVG